MTDWEKVNKRISNSAETLGHPHNDYDGLRHNLKAREGEDYKVLASTDQGGYFYPTIVRWANGETDSFTDLEKSIENRDESKMLELEE